MFLCSSILFNLCSLSIQDMQNGAITSLYLLCCILRMVKTKDLANVIAAALFCPLQAFIAHSLAKHNGFMSAHEFSHESKVDAQSLRFDHSNSPSTSQAHPVDSVENDCDYLHVPLR